MHFQPDIVYLYSNLFQILICSSWVSDLSSKYNLFSFLMTGSWRNSLVKHNGSKSNFPFIPSFFTILASMIAKLLSLSNTIFSYLQFHALLEEKKVNTPCLSFFPFPILLPVNSTAWSNPHTYTVTVYIHSMFKDFIIKQLAYLTSTAKNDR